MPEPKLTDETFEVALFPPGPGQPRPHPKTTGAARAEQLEDR